MKKSEYEKLKSYMQLCMEDSAHDKEHIYRVLYNALEIAKFEENVNYDVLIAACLLHDIGRKEQFENTNLCHANVGSQKAFAYLVSLGWDEKKASHVQICIMTHRYRADNPPSSIEAKILFDADKLDATGTLGIARTLMYKAQVNEPLYNITEDGKALDGSNCESPSFFQEYKFKLEKLYNRFYTIRGYELAKLRQSSAVAFYKAMLVEVQVSYENGLKLLNDKLI